MSVRSRCLASLLALLAAAGASRAEDPPPPAPEPANEAEAQLQALQAAYQAERWEEVIERSLSCLKAAASPRDQWRVVLAMARAHFGLGQWAESAGFSRKCLDWAAESPAVEATQHLIRGLVRIEAESLIALDRFPEAESRLDAAAERDQNLREDPWWKSCRDLARTPTAVRFEAPEGLRQSDAQRFELGRLRLERAIPTAMDHIRRRLGSPDLPFPPIRVIVDDSEPADGDYLARASVVARGSGWIGLIRVRLEAVLHPTMQDEQLLAHELAHVLHLAGTKLLESPPWLREGIAHWVEAADDLRHREMVLWRAIRPAGSPEASVGATLEIEAALEAADYETQRVCGSVVFFHLERMLGRTAVQRLVLRLLKEGDWAAVLKEETRLDMHRLLEKVDSGYLEWATATFPEKAVMLEASRLAQEGKLREAVKVVDAFLEGVAAGPTRSLAELHRLNLLLTLEDWPAARAALAPIHALRRSQPLASSVGNGVMSEVAVLRGSGDWEGLAALAREARESLWVLDREWRAELDKALAEAEKHLAEAAPPK